MLRKWGPWLAPKVSAGGTAAAATASGTNMNSQQQVLEITSPYSLLRMCYRSIDITVKSRHARMFLKQRLIEQWAEKSKETNPEKQRFNMDLAGSFLQALHTERNPKPGKPVQFQLSRRVAYEQRQQERAEAAAKTKTKTVHRMPSAAKLP